jgi:hypothetical protein
MDRRFRALSDEVARLQQQVETKDKNLNTLSQVGPSSKLIACKDDPGYGSVMHGDAAALVYASGSSCLSAGCQQLQLDSTTMFAAPGLRLACAAAA